MNEHLVFLVVGAILAVSLFIATVASRMGVPSLIAFLAIGMVLGPDGLATFEFIDAHTAQIVGTIGLAVILFEGGLSTSWRRLREAAVPAVLLSTFGVLITAALTGVTAYLIFDLDWLYALLLGAVVSSTDAAAVFATLRFTSIRRRLARTLEAETGGNDPMAIALTIGLITWIQHSSYGGDDLFWLVVQEMGLGLVVGLAMGLLAMRIFSRLPPAIGAFAPVASLAAGALAFGLAGAIGGSGFLAIYLVGLAIGSTPSRYRSQLTAFHEGFAFLAQVALFIVLGLLVTPKDLAPVALPSLLLAILLVIVIRPLAVYISLLPLSRFTVRDKALIGWAGLRGAVPIVLGTFVLTSEISNAHTIFNVVFFVVIISALIQGTTLEWMAKRLGVIDKSFRETTHADGVSNISELVEFDIAPWHSIAGSTINELGLPGKVTISRVKRKSKAIKFDGKTVLYTGDKLYVSVPNARRPELDDVITRWRRRI